MADFEALYPNIDVSMRLYTDYSRIYNDVITNIATNTTPNVCITYPDHIATYLTGTDVVVPLDELFADARYGFGGSELRYDAPAQDEIIASFFDECTIGGVHYAIPFMRSTEACYVNKSISDRIVVMKDGVVQQIGRPQDVYDSPVNLFVAKFLGTPPINVFEGEVRGGLLRLGEDAVLKAALPDQKVSTATAGTGTA